MGISGALHLDGLIDTCDGLAGSTPAKRLEIMTNSHIGAYGGSGAVIMLLLKYAVIVSLPPEWRLEAWLLAPALGSWTMVLALFIFPYARQSGGLGRHFKQEASKRRLAIASLLTLAAAIGLAGWQGLILTVAACLITLGTGCFFNARLGGPYRRYLRGNQGNNRSDYADYTNGDCLYYLNREYRLMKLFIVRHGETDYNRQGRYQGRTDTTLNKTGLRQAQALCQRLFSERD